MSANSDSVSGSSIVKANGDIEENKSPADITSRSRQSIRRAIEATNPQDILLFLVGFRLLNALIVRTFFQPDEYYQSLEPAWQMSFGESSGAWITWEWKNHLRSAIHPTLFAAIYWISNSLANLLSLSSDTRAQLLLAAPKAFQGFAAAIGDYYTWRLSQRIYGHASSEATATLALSILSPWQWFCSTRTFSNGLETTLTIVALYHWPFQWSLNVDEDEVPPMDSQGLRTHEAQDAERSGTDEVTSLRRALLFASLATVLRPTNVLIWMILGILTLFKPSNSGWLVKIPWTDQSAWVDFTSLSLQPSRVECLALFRESAICGTAVLLLSALVDRFYYQTWTFPPINFLYFNLVQSLAMFYGKNDLHYYLSQGIPLLLTTALPFAAVGIYQTLQETSSSHPQTTSSAKTISQLATISLGVPAALSFIAHKEVRFIYPLLPMLHILSAPVLTSFFLTSLNPPLRDRPPYIVLKRFLVTAIIAINLLIAIYTTTVHNSGLISITDYLRQQHEMYYLSSSPPRNLTAAFFMPCHSTPWRSHLLYPPSSSIPGISAWALTCEPPLHLSHNSSLRAAYLDEADIFYSDPGLWLRKHMSRHPPRSKGIFSSNALPRRRDIDPGGDTNGRRREWPDYLIFFEQLESVMHVSLQGSGYGECWRAFNSHWHDDWRRKGDVLVWCLDHERRTFKEETSRLGLNSKVVREWLGGVGEKLESATRTESQPTDGKRLGGGRGPWGIGLGGEGAHAGEKLVAGESVVEKPFWKKREPLPPNAAGREGRGVWATIRNLVWPFGSAKQKRWWEGGRWT